MTSPNIGPKPFITQNIKYTGSESEYSAAVVGQNVIVHCAPGDHNHGSSKVKLINRSDYNWEFRYYYGHLVSAHVNGKVVAYAMKGKDGGMIRVCNQETNQRCLIKNLKDDVKDLSFAYSRSDIILGCVDCEGNILVYQILDTPSSMKHTLLLHIYHPDRSIEVNVPKPSYRIIWCPYLSNYEDDDNSDDPEKMFVLLNGTKAEVYNVGMVNNIYGVGPLDTNDSYEGYIEINHTDDLVDAAFSSDGTAIAIACLDGYVRFFQLYMVDNEKQKCLHEWRPHEGKPLSSIIFIDNVLEYSAECWKFTITGANNNSEIKLWSCESWTCLQTIHFQADPKSLIPNIFLNLAIDYTGQYLIISEINNKLLYVLQLSRNDEKKMVSVVTMSQFLIPAPILSFHVLDASIKKIPFEDIYDDRDDYEEEEVYNWLKLLIIQPKRYQECNIMFQPDGMMYNKSTVLNECELKEEKVPKLDDLQDSVQLLIQQETSKSQLNLMTPEDFTVDKNSRPGSVKNNSITNEQTLNNSLEKVESVENLIEFQRPQKENFASGGSSPSREVQEILSLKNSTTYLPNTQDYFDKLNKLEDETKPIPLTKTYLNKFYDESTKTDEKPQKDYNNLKDNNEIVWPKIPVVENNDVIDGDTTLRQDIVVNNISEDSDISKTNVQAINFRISSLENTIREQNILITTILQEMKNSELNQIEKRKLDKLEFIKEVETILAKQQLQITNMFENMIHIQKNKDRELQENILATVSQVLTKSLVEKLQNILSNEMKVVVLPAVHTLIENYRKQVDSQYMQKMNNTDIKLRDTITKTINNKELADSLSVSVVNIVAPSLEKCYRDFIYSTLVPSWEKVCSQMFQQINDTFTRGTKEYTASVESYMDRQRRVQEKGKDLIAQMQEVSDKIWTNADKLNGTMSTEMHKQFNVAFKGMQEQLTNSIKEVVNEEVKEGFKKHASVIEDSVMNAVRTRAVTPSPHMDSQMTMASIQQNIQRGNFDEAFQLALSAENLSYVIYVCERVDVNVIFGEECLLQQSCLLALIQQLSMELTKNTELKLSYIRAAFLALSLEYTATKQFAPKVLKDLLKQLHLYMASNPPLKQLSTTRLLKMAVESMMRDIDLFNSS